MHNNPLKYIDPSGNHPVIGAIPRIIQGIRALITGATVIAGGITISEGKEKTKDFAIPVPNTIAETRNKSRNNETITLYHATNSSGASNILSKGIDIFYGRDHLDFGQGFYVTNDITQADGWVKNRYSGVGEILIFQVDANVFSSYSGKSFDGNSKAWRSYVFNNRNGFSSTLEHYDYVEGPYLANPDQRKYSNEYKAKGHQIAIKDTNLAKEIFSGYIGSYSIGK